MVQKRRCEAYGTILQISNDLIAKVCEHLDDSARVSITLLSCRFSMVGVASLLKRSPKFVHLTIARQRQRYQNSIQKLLITSSDFANFSNDDLLPFTMLRMLKVNNYQSDKASDLRVYELLKLQHTYLQSLEIFRSWRSETNHNSYQLPCNIERLILSGPFHHFSVSNLSRLRHLHLHSLLFWDHRIENWLNKLPTSLRFLALKLPYNHDFQYRPSNPIPAFEYVQALDLNFDHILSVCIKPFFWTILSSFRRLESITLQALIKFESMEFQIPANVHRVVLRNCSSVDFSFLTNKVSILRLIHCSLDVSKLPSNLTCLDFLQVDIPSPVAMNAFGTCLTILRLSSTFNYPLSCGVLPHTLTTLLFTNDCMEGDFNQKLDHGSLPPSLNTLVFGNAFNQVLDEHVLPLSLTSLHFGIDFEHTTKAQILGTNLLILTLPTIFATIIFPASLKELNTRFFPDPPCKQMLNVPKYCQIYNYTCYDQGMCTPCHIIKSSKLLFEYNCCPCASCTCTHK